MIVGVDPGLSGAIVALPSMGKPVLWVMPTIGKEIAFGKIAEYLRAANDRFDPAHVFLERSQAFPKMGVCSAFSYGASYWGVLAICAALEIPVTTVAPVKWHRALVSGTDGTPKGRALIACERLFPGVELRVGKARNAHEGLVDSLLIAEFGRRQLQGGTTT